MKKETEQGFIALTLSVSEEEGSITTGLVDNLGEDVAENHRALLYSVVFGLSAMLRTDMARVGALGELSQLRDAAEAMQEDILSAAEAEEDEDHPQMEVVFEPSPELEERIRKSGLH
jgi:hypothetical protein